jgi:hypothetical protein
MIVLLIILGAIGLVALMFLAMYFVVWFEGRNNGKVVLSGLFNGIPVKMEFNSEKQAIVIYKVIKPNFSANDNRTIRLCAKFDKI